ncbi:MAG: hypothetical protein NDI77_03450 [Geobacteraceae bacterium]|nr:hypothetical protein [Geobacteraceae bacterium]
MKRVLATGGAGGGAEEVESVQIDPHATYREVTIKLWGKGVVLRREASGSGETYGVMLTFEDF